MPKRRKQRYYRQRSSTHITNNFPVSVVTNGAAAEASSSSCISGSASTDPKPGIEELPGLVIQNISGFLDDASLMRFGQALGHCGSKDSGKMDRDWNLIWQNRLRRSMHYAWCAPDTHKFSAKQRFLATKFWKSRRVDRIEPFYRFRQRFMPCLRIDSDNLYFSMGNIIEHRSLLASPFTNSCEKYVPNHFWNLPSRNYRFIGNQRDRWNDICRFAIDEKSIIAATCSGSILAFDINRRNNWRNLYGVEYKAHVADVHDVDLRGDTVVSASRDWTVGVWRRDAHLHLSPVGSLNVEDRAHCVEISPSVKNVAVGTAACRKINPQPLKIWDLETCAPIAVFDTEERYGSAIVDVKFMQDSDWFLASAGLDSIVKLWDLRANECVWQWEEPSDRGFMSLAADSNYSIIAGTRRNSVVWILDTRFDRRLTGYFLSKQSSPVYSVAFTTKNIFAALDRALVAVSVP